MLKFYCVECGNPTTYSLNKPKFCSSCGKNFSIINNTSKSSVVTKKNNNFLDEDTDLDLNEEEVGSFNKNISELDFEIISEKTQASKLKDVIGTSPRTKKDKTFKKSGARMSKSEKKKILEEFSREAGTLKKKNKDG